MLLALAAGSVLSQIEVPPDSWFDQFLFQGTADDARTLLIGISGTMMTVIALVLGLTLVALQLSSTQFSPRLLRNFLRDRTNQLVLAVFVATFTYATAGLYTVGIEEGRRVDEYPRLAVTVAILLLFGSLMVLVFFVHHISHAIQVDCGHEARGREHAARHRPRPADRQREHRALPRIHPRGPLRSRPTPPATSRPSITSPCSSLPSPRT